MPSHAACSAPDRAQRAPYVVGLTGGIGSGKSLVAELLAARGACVVDTDAVSRELTGAGGAAIAPLRAAFGQDALDRHGALDRGWMRARAFADPAAKRRLEAILHPLIAERVHALLAQPAQALYVLLVVPLLVETGYWLPRVQRVLVVDCPVAQQVARVVATRHLARAQVEAIVAQQASRAARLDAADDVLVNAGCPAALAARAAMLHAHYLRLAAHWRERAAPL